MCLALGKSRKPGDIIELTMPYDELNELLWEDGSAQIRPEPGAATVQRDAESGNHLLCCSVGRVPYS